MELAAYHNPEERKYIPDELLVAGKFDVCVTSFEMAINEKTSLCRFSWRYIIIDEAHRIKNENSLLSKTMRLFSTNYPLLITGTPLQPNAEPEANVTPLLSAVAAGSVACLELLVKAGAKANVFAGGATPLHIAADIGDLELINSLLKAGADPNQKDEEGNRPLEVAALRENINIVETLFPLTTNLNLFQIGQ